MSKMKKLFAVLLTMIMALSMMVVGFAEVQGDKTKNAEVTINNLDKAATQVGFYKLIKTTVNADKSITYELTDLAKNALGSEATVETITGDDVELQSIYAKVMNYAYNNKIAPDKTANVTNQSVTQELELGCYAALVTTSGKIVYNPMIVSVNANVENGVLVDATAVPADGLTAKYTDITENKDTTNGATTPTQEGGSASVGDKVEFTLSATIPTYPKDAQNKTLYMMDTLTKGLTLGTNDSKDTANFKLHVGDKVLDLPHDAAKVVEEARDEKTGEKTFAVVFDYDKLKEISGTATEVKVTYNVTVNTNAVVAGAGNKNTYKLVYANNPTQGGTYVPGEGEKPNPINPGSNRDGITTSEEHTQTIKTYAFAIKKIDASTSEALEGAEFDVFADAEGKVKVGTIITDDKGYGVLSGVEEGTYYIKETKAPNGYTVLAKTFVLTVNATNSQVYSSYTTTSSTKTTAQSYTEEKYMTADEYAAYKAVKKAQLQTSEGTTSFTEATPVSGFYRNANGEIFTTDALKEAKILDANGAFLKDSDKYEAVNKYTVTTEVVTTESMSTSTETLTGNTDEAKAFINIPNTPLVGLPSTGGIGTTIFTIAGVLVMIAAAAMFFASRRKRA